MAAVAICSDFGAPQNKVCHCFYCFRIYLPWSDETRYHDPASSRLSETRLENCRACLHPYLISSFHQPWVFIGRTDAEAEALTLRAPDAKSPLIRKDPDAGKDWRQEEKGVTEDKMVGWHHQLNGYEFEQTPGDGEGQGSLVCCSPWGHRESDTTEQLKNNHHPWTVAIRPLSSPLRLGTHNFEGKSLLCLPLSGKAIELIFSISPRTLSLRLNSAPLQKGQDFSISRTITIPLLHR